MATVPSLDTWNAGEKPTAAKMNRNIRDAGNFFLNTPFGWGYRTAALTLADGAWTDVALDTEKVDTDAMFSTSAGFVIVTPGWYALRGGVRFVANATGHRGCRIRQNGADVDVVYAAAASGMSATVRPEAEVYCSAGDTLTLGVYTSGAGSLALSVAQPYYTYLRARWMAA
ncbi:hypothetical protein [Streptomyces paradoxus]|uniref:hypothetical protein n=1 Tax=Streptomyces paradoxus TaxID=66375 RepID=UPI0037D1933B